MRPFLGSTTVCSEAVETHVRLDSSCMLLLRRETTISLQCKLSLGTGFQFVIHDKKTPSQPSLHCQKSKVTTRMTRRPAWETRGTLPAVQPSPPSTYSVEAIERCWRWGNCWYEPKLPLLCQCDQHHHPQEVQAEAAPRHHH